jgi:hypothetical protein
MFNSKMYALLAVALGVAVAAPAQAGWNAWNAPPTTGTAREQPTVAPAPARESGYEAYARARKRRLPSTNVSTPGHHPGMTGHTFHHPGH